jgi:hypothetical protein
MSKIPAIAITLDRAEGPRSETGKPVRITSWKGPGSIWDAANAELLRMSRTAPERGGGYDKTDFKIEYADGETYKGRIDLQRGENNDVDKHMRDFLTFMGGQRKPAHMSKEKYEAYIRSVNQEDPGYSENVLEWLDKYEIG